jgi:hypothetical protein
MAIGVLPTFCSGYIYSDVRFAVDEFLGMTGLLQRRNFNHIGLLLQISAPVLYQLVT